MDQLDPSNYGGLLRQWLPGRSIAASMLKENWYARRLESRIYRRRQISEYILQAFPSDGMVRYMQPRAGGGGVDAKELSLDAWSHSGRCGIQRDPFVADVLFLQQTDRCFSFYAVRGRYGRDAGNSGPHGWIISEEPPVVSWGFADFVLATVIGAWISKSKLSVAKSLMNGCRRCGNAFLATASSRSAA
jgi:hypothetical protein